MKNMHSILIADDEKHVRNDIIQSMHWSDYGFYITEKELRYLYRTNFFVEEIRISR